MLFQVWVAVPPYLSPFELRVRHDGGDKKKENRVSTGPRHTRHQCAGTAFPFHSKQGLSTAWGFSRHHAPCSPGRAGAVFARLVVHMYGRRHGTARPVVGTGVRIQARSGHPLEP